MKKNLICYCFGFSEEDIIRDVFENRGISSIVERILSEKKKGACNCKFNHPEGR
jgi:hypothetical protein